MKKSMKNYIICWIALVALFNVICFAIPMEKSAGSFWTAYGFSMAAFVGHLLYVCVALSADSREKKILNTPLMIISYAELMLMILAGTVCMAVPVIPNWAGVVMCSAVFAFSIIFLVTAQTAGENASNANERLNAKTSDFRNMVNEAQLLVSKAKSAEAKSAARKVSEALRYSDPVSGEATQMMEVEIQTKLQELSDLIAEESSVNTIQSQAEELLNLIEARNNQCKVMKRQRV